MQVLPVATSTPPPVHGFAPAFFECYVPVSSTAVAEPGQPDAPRVCYDAGFDGSHEAFCGSERFGRYRKQMRENLDFIVARAKALDMKDVVEIEARFATFYKHRFEQAYFDLHKELVDSAGKRSLDSFCAMLRNKRLRPEQQIEAIRNLSLGVTVCASGTVANLINADRDLSLSVGGIRDRLWRLKEETARNAIQQAVSVGRGGMEDPEDVLWEVHYVNAVWNDMADALGLQRIPDSTAVPFSSAFLASCRQQVLAALSPDKLAARIAEDCLAVFRSRTVVPSRPASGECTPATLEWFVEVLGDIRRDLGLADDTLQLHAFVRLDDDGRNYHVRDDPALIAVALLRSMNAIGLLTETPVRLPDTPDNDGGRIELYGYGSRLAWRLLRQEAANTAAAPSWGDQHPVDAIGTRELRAWRLQAETQADGEAPPQVAIHHAVRNASAAELPHVRADWLGSAQAILDLLKRLEPEQAVAYLGHNLPYLLVDLPVDQRELLVHEVIDLGEPGLTLARAWYSELWLVRQLAPAKGDRYLKDDLHHLLENVPAGQRGAWADEVMHRGEAGKTLVRAWYPDPWTLLAETRREEGARHERTRLEYWIASGNAAALDAVCQLVDEGWRVADPSVFAAAPMSRSPDVAAALFRARLRQAMLNRPDVVRAMHRLCRQLLALPDMGHHVARHLPGLFPLSVIHAFETGDPDIIAAFRGMLTDPLLLSHIADALPAILLKDGSYRGYPASYLLWMGSAALVETYGALLADMAELPDTGERIARLLMPKWTATLVSNNRHPVFGQRAQPVHWGCFTLLDASERGSIAVIQAYHAVLVHPRILPRIRHALPELLLGAPRKWHWSSRQRDTVNRLFDTRLPGYPACHALFTDPGILPSILDALPWTAKAIRTRLQAPAAGADATG